MLKAALSKPAAASRRQDPISCSLCRRKKLRCNRQNPCSNCVARNVTCNREGSLPAVPAQAGTAAAHTGGAASTDVAILTRLDRLEGLILQMNANSQSRIHSSGLPVLKERTPESVKNPLMDVNGSESAHVVDTKILEDVGTRGYSLFSGLSDGIHFKILPLKSIPTAHLQLQSRNPTQINGPRTILLPVLTEGLVLLDVYAEHVEYLHHIVLISKVRSQIHSLYSYLSDTTCAPTRDYSVMSMIPALAPAALILSIFASAAACLAEIRPFALERSLSLSIMTISEAKSLLNTVDKSSVRVHGTLPARWFRMH